MAENTIDKQELIELLGDTEVKEAIKDGLRSDAVDIGDLPEAVTLTGKSLPIVDGGELKSIPYQSIADVVSDAQQAITDATEATSNATDAASAANLAAAAAAAAAEDAAEAAEEVDDAIGNNLRDVRTYKEVEYTLPTSGSRYRYINSNGVWHDGSADNNCYFIAVKPGDTIKVIANDAHSNVQFLRTNEALTSGTPDYADGESFRPWFSGTLYAIVPSDCTYLYFRENSSGTSARPKSISKIIYIKNELEEVKEDTLPPYNFMDTIDGLKVYDDIKLSAYGNELTGVGWHVTDFIPFNTGTVGVLYNTQETGTACLVAYDEFKAPIGIWSTKSGTLVNRSLSITNENTAYVRFCYNGNGCIALSDTNGTRIWYSQLAYVGMSKMKDALLNGQCYKESFTSTGGGSTSKTIILGKLTKGMLYKLHTNTIEGFDSYKSSLMPNGSRYTLMRISASLGNAVLYAGYPAMPIPEDLEFIAEDNDYYQLAFRATSGTEVGVTLYRPLAEQDVMSQVSDLKASIYKNAEFIEQPTEMTPDPTDDVFNAKRRENYAQNDNYQQNDNYKQYLCWMPRVMVAGGGMLTINIADVSGISYMQVHEWPWRGLDLNPMTSDFKTTELIKSSDITLPAESGDVSLILQPTTKRIIIYICYTENVTPSTISTTLSSAIIPVADYNDWTFNNGDGASSESSNAIMSIVKEAHWKSPARSESPQLLGLLHFSDIHASTTSANQLKTAIAKYGEYIDDVLNTGDVVQTQAIYSETSYDRDRGLLWWQECGLANKCLFTLGNHDCSSDTDSVGDLSRAWSFDAYFADYITANGYVMPSGYDNSSSPNYKATYWHKDYTAQKIRLIGLDCMNHFDGVLNPETGAIISAGKRVESNSMELWLIEKLNETLANSGNAAAGYTVIIASHYPLDDYSGDNAEWDSATNKWVLNHNDTGGRVMSQVDKVTHWHTYTDTSYTASVSYHWRNRTSTSASKGSVNNVGDILQHYIDSGGNFCAWLCGHRHIDYAWYPTMYPDILNIGIIQAGHRRDQYVLNRDDICLTANLVFVDTYLKLFKLVRVGNTGNQWLRPTTYFCYNYDTRTVISEG